MRFDWDNHKSQLLKQKRGYSLEEVATILADDYVERIMNRISIEEIEQKIEAGEEVIERYFDSTTTRVGTPRQMTSRRRQDLETTKVEIPSSILNELDKIATELNISRQAVIAMMLRRTLDEHYLAKKQMKSEI
ncbi:hypothetical protein [Iningainema tapete]|nr:hypothetical protein [Iningainema tapete]